MIGFRRQDEFGHELGNPGSVAAMSEAARADSPLRSSDSVHDDAPLPQIKAMVLLAGSFRRHSFARALGRSVLDLPVGADESLMEHWQHQAAMLAEQMSNGKGGHLPVRLMLARHSLPPHKPAVVKGVAMHVEHDPVEYRGMGGVLRDLCDHYHENDLILVANAAQVLLESLVNVVRQLADRVAESCNGDRADVVLASHEQGIPAGLMLIRCKALACIPPLGYVDMKEQALPMIARHHNVQVVRRDQPSGAAMRTLSDYISAVRQYQSSNERVSQSHVDGAFAEDWRPRFSIAESGASVHPSAQVHDSVVMDGGRVDAGAVLVRSVVGPGGVVAPQQRVVDKLISKVTQSEA